MPILAICIPILPGKMEQWNAMMDHVKSTPEFAQSRDSAGVHERTFVQETPAGDFLIITLEGEDPAAGWAKIMGSMPAEFAQFAKDVHGIDVHASPSPIPKLVFDSKIHTGS